MLDVATRSRLQLTPEVPRQRTAIGRRALSVPMQRLLKFECIRQGVTVFDYGCGRGDDVKHLVQLGINATGWDPFYFPDAPIVRADVVNLGFVINIIEDLDERVAVLQEAFNLARHVLSVSAMLTHNQPRKVTPFRDGVITQRGTFQKFYRQEELQRFIQACLGVEAVAVGRGIFFVNQ